MPTLNVNVPQFECYVRDSFLYNFENGDGRFTKGICHAVSCISGRALGFHVLLDNGAHIGRLPIHALVAKTDAPHVDFDKPWELQLWDCFSYKATCTEFDWLAGLRCGVYLPDGKRYGGTYMFTIDYYGSQTSEAAGDAGWKAHHIVELDDGRLAAQPNNRIVWFEPSSVVPFKDPPKYKTMTRTWKCENGSKWRCSDDNLMFYNIDTQDGSWVEVNKSFEEVLRERMGES